MKNSCARKAGRVGCGIRDRDGSVFCKSTDSRRDGELQCIFDQPPFTEFNQSMKKTKTDNSTTSTKKSNERQRNAALDDVLAISDGFGVIGARACQVRPDAKGGTKASFPVPLDRNEAIVSAVRMMMDEPNPITGVVVFTAGRKSANRKALANKIKKLA